MSDKVDQRLDDHERRISDLEKNHYEMRNSMLRIENVVLTEGKEQKQLLNKLIDHIFLDKKDARNSKVKISEYKWTTILGLFSGGSAVVLVVQWLLSLV